MEQKQVRIRETIFFTVCTMAEIKIFAQINPEVKSKNVSHCGHMLMKEVCSGVVRLLA